MRKGAGSRPAKPGSARSPRAGIRFACIFAYAGARKSLRGQTNENVSGIIAELPRPPAKLRRLRLLNGKVTAGVWLRGIDGGKSMLRGNQITHGPRVRQGSRERRV